MKRLAASLCVLLCALVLPFGALAAAGGHVSGTLIGASGRTFAIGAAGGRMSVLAALAVAADNVTAGDFPYVYGGGHAQAGIASTGAKGPGYNGRRIGFDCSGSVTAVLSEAGCGRWRAVFPTILA